MLFKYSDRLLNQSVMCGGFEFFHGEVLNGYSLCQCVSYGVLGQSVSCANTELSAQWLKKFTHKLHSFLMVLFYILWVLFDL